MEKVFLLSEITRDDFCEDAFIVDVDSVKFPLRFLSGGENIRRIVIIFQGAVNRDKRQVPVFFPFLPNLSGIAHQLSVSDPTMFSKEGFDMSWYAGHESLPCQKMLPKLISVVKEIFDIDRTVYFGSSAGGFASLYYSWGDSGSVSVAVSPQTNILLYYSSHVKRYIESCWPTISEIDGLAEKIVVDISGLYKEKMNNTVIYIQSVGDQFHFSKHLIPFLGVARPNISKNGNGLILNCDFWGTLGHSGSVTKNVYMPWVYASLTSVSVKVEDVLKTYHNIYAVKNIDIKNSKNEKKEDVVLSRFDLEMTSLLRDWQLKHL